MKKTLFCEAVDDVFLKSLSKEPRPTTSKKQLGAYLKISSSQEKKYFQYYFELHDHFIFCKKGEGEKEIAFMDINFAFMKRTTKTKIDGEDHFGIKFIKQKTYEELFSSDEAAIEEWFTALKKYCIMTKFRSFFKTIKVIGKGNFAKVFLV